MVPRTRHKGSMDNGGWWEEKAYLTMVVLLWSGDMDGRCFMCATPYTLNLLQVRCMGERKSHLQNLQQFKNKFKIEKQGPWNEIKTKNISHYRRLGPKKIKR